MSASQEIIKTALLGTGKYFPAKEVIPDDLLTLLQTNDKEHYFLRLANAVFLYEEAGQESSIIEEQFHNPLNENKASVSASNQRLLKSFIQSNDDLLLHYLIVQCKKHQRVVNPECVPDILNKALQHKHHSMLYTEVCGETGQWLCSLNADWQHLSFQLETDAWEHGTFQTRVEYLKKLRTDQSKDIIPLMQIMFDEENATNRLLLLDILQLNLTSSDETFLVSLQKDKSQKIRERSFNLLIQIPGTEFNLQCITALQNLMSIKEERFLLISKKKKIQLNKDAILNEELLKLGIEKVCSIKGVNDQAFWAMQIMSLLPPSQTAVVMHCNETELLELLLNENEFKQLTPYIHQCAIRFKHTEWAKILIRNAEAPDIRLLNCLPDHEQVDYYNSLIEQNHVALLEYLLNEQFVEISHTHAIKMLDRLEKDPYVNSSNLYQRFALALPPSMNDILKKKSEIEKDDYQFRYFKNQVLEMLRVLDIKQTIKF